MKKLLVLLPLVFACMAASAQLSYFTVSATITDPAAHPYANAGYSISLVDSHGYPVSSASTPNGQLFNAQTVSGNLDTAGHFSVQLVPNNILSKPSGTQWKFTITAPTDSSILLYQAAWNLTYQTAITGNVDLSSQISASAQGIQFANLKTGQSTMGGTDATARAAAAAAQATASAALPANGCSTTGGGILSCTNVAGGAVGGTFYASKYPGQSNNGIASTFADATRCGASGSGGVGGCTVIADPAYPMTEQPYRANGKWTFPSGSNTLFHDQRKGWDFLLSHDPYLNNFEDNSASSFTDACMFTKLNGWSGGLVSWASQQTHCRSISWVFASPGMNMGTTSPSRGGWTVGQGIGGLGVENTRGISLGLGITNYKAGIGDTTNYIYNYSYGGAVAGSDEGSHPLSFGGGEMQFRFAGTVNAGSTGATSIKIGCTADCWNAGDGRFDIDLSRGISGNVTAKTLPNGGTNTLGTFTTDVAVPVSTAWGVLNAGIDTPIGTPIGSATTMTAVINSAGGNTGQFQVGDTVCLAGSWHEMSKIATVSGTGPWTVTFPLRYIHGAGEWIYANGACSYFIDFAANDVAWSGVTLRYPSDIIGSTDAHTLQYRYYSLNGATNSYTGNVVLASLIAGFYSNTGGTVSIPSANFSGQAAYMYLGQPVITISGATDTTFNGQCTNVHASPSNTATPGLPLLCTQASSTGHTSSESNIKLAIGTTAYGNTAFTMYPGAELIDMLDYDATACTAASMTAPCMDGTHTLEPNNVPWTVGDSMENSHHYAQVMGIERGWAQNFNPTGGYSGRTAYVGPNAHGNSYGSNYGGYAAADYIGNSTAYTNYIGHGGIEWPIGGYTLAGVGAPGLYNWGLLMSNAPDPIGSSVLNVGCPVSGCSDTSYFYNVFALGGASTGALTYRPGYNTFIWSGIQDSPTFYSPIITSKANGTAATLELDSYDGSAVKHASTISASSTGGPYALSLPANSGTLALVSDIPAATGVFPIVQGTTRVGGGSSGLVTMGDYSNLVLWSADLTHGGAWNLGAFTPTGGQTDPWGGTTATQLVSNGGNDNYSSFPSTFTTTTTYCVSSWMKGAVGGEVVAMYAGNTFAGGGTLTTSWARYSGSVTTISAGGAGWHQSGSVVTFYVAGLQVTAGACPSVLPAYVVTGGSTVATATALASPTMLTPNGLVLNLPTKGGTLATTTWTCETGLGDGLNAAPSGTYLQSFCWNKTGLPVTLTGLACYTDNSGSSTMNAAGNTLGALLTGAVTCSTSLAAGTQSANVVLTANDYIKFTWIADGTSKQTSWVVTGTY